jgi:hypothetical protein
LPAALHAFCGKNLADPFKASLYIVIDKDIILAVPVADFGLGAAHAVGDDRFAILRAAV